MHGNNKIYHVLFVEIFRYFTFKTESLMYVFQLMVLNSDEILETFFVSEMLFQRITKIDI